MQYSKNNAFSLKKYNNILLEYSIKKSQRKYFNNFYFQKKNLFLFSEKICSFFSKRFIIISYCDYFKSYRKFHKENNININKK